MPSGTSSHVEPIASAVHGSQTMAHAIVVDDERTPRDVRLARAERLRGERLERRGCAEPEREAREPDGPTDRAAAELCGRDVPEHGDVDEAEQREAELRECDRQREARDRLELASLAQRRDHADQGRAS